MKKSNDFFWPSYTDLMTSLFFIMLVLYVLTYVRLNSTIKLQKEKLSIIETVEQNLKPLKKDKTLFVYEEQYKRFKLAFDVKFNSGRSGINNDDLINFSSTISKIDLAGYKLKTIIDTLNQLKNTDIKLKNVSYILVLAGYASKNGEEIENYKLSYLRSLNLKNYWKNKGIDFESNQYKGLIDLQISGNGWGGVGRILDIENESDNQRFLIQIFPKIGNVSND
jgi:outer membrane protein OmpA-like peptidoglycan-associated protein